MPVNGGGLVQRQASLIEMIFGTVELNTSLETTLQSKGLQIYRHNLLMTAGRALGISYPVLEKMLGAETMTALSKRLLQVFELPASGDWGDWGESLAALIKTTQLHSEHPYLAETAELEWLVHRASRERATTLNAASLELLAKPAIEDIRIRLGESLGVMQSRFALDEICHLHQQVERAEQVDEQVFFDLVNQQNQRYFFLVYQRDHLPVIERLTEKEYDWFKDIAAGFSVSQLLDQHPQLDFSQWLRNAIEKQWLLGFRDAMSC